MVTRPPIIWFPADARNVLARPGGAMWEAVCIHTTDGGSSVEDLGAWFGGKNLAEGLSSSAHFGVGRDGRLGQFVSLTQSAIAQGHYDRPTAKLATQPLNSNHWCIGIELLDGGTPGDHTPQQLAATANLVAWLFQDVIGSDAAKTGAALDRDHVLGHYQFDAVTRAFCPSWPEARFADCIARAKALLTPAPTPGPRDYHTELKAELEAEIRAAEGRLTAIKAETLSLTLALESWRKRLAGL